MRAFVHGPVTHAVSEGLKPPSHSFIEGKEAVALTSYQAEGPSCHRSVKGFI